MSSTSEGGKKIPETTKERQSENLHQNIAKQGGSNQGTRQEQESNRSAPANKSTDNRRTDKSRDDK